MACADRQPELGQLILWWRKAFRVSNGSHQQTGRYTNGAPGYRLVLEITIVDKTKNVVVGGTTELHGEDPPDAILSSEREGTGFRWPSDQEILKHLATLPRVP